MNGHMTDHNREDLIEKAAKAIAKSANADYWTDEIAEWEGAEGWEREAHPDERPHMAYEDREEFHKQARAALAVFEQAHPVQGPKNSAQNSDDDERDELEVQDLSTIIGNVVIDYEDTGPHSQRPITIRDTCADWPMEIAGELLAAGFRRTVRAEPTDAEVEAAMRGYLKAYLENVMAPSTHLFRAALRAAAEATGHTTNHEIRRQS